MTIEEGQALAAEFGLELFEVSALHNHGIKEAMEHLAKKITTSYEITKAQTYDSDLDFANKERMSVGTETSRMPFKLDYTSTGRFECCMSRDKNLNSQNQGCMC